MERIKTLFDRLCQEPFPSKRWKEVLGVDLVLIDSDTIGLTTRFLHSKGHLTTEEIKMLESCFEDLSKIVPQLEQNERQYFASLKQLANEMLEMNKVGKLSDSEVAQRHKWKIAYNQIKDIVNELDPIGVADIVDDEYDDLNFKIYSQLLANRQDRIVFITIKTFIEQNYGVQASDIGINETVQKLKRISLDN